MDTADRMALADDAPRCEKKTRRLRSLFFTLLDKQRALSGFLSAGKEGAWAALSLLLLYDAFCLTHSLFSFVSGWLLVPASLLIVVLAALLLRLALRLLVGRTTLSRALYLLALVLAVLFPFWATGGERPGFAFSFGFLLVTAADLLGRCLVAQFFRRRRSAAFAPLLALSLLILSGAAALVLPHGFAQGTLKKYAALSPAVSAAPAGFADAIGKGSHEVFTLSYGVGEGFDLRGDTRDLSAFAQREGLEKFAQGTYFDTDLKETPLAGRIWLPADEASCPVLFIVHGNHDYAVDSYLGYEYLGEYLASWGYAVVSVDENYCNGLSHENDARAVLLLEHVGQLLRWNSEREGPLYQRLDPARIALAGHSRGGEAVSTAALFNGYNRYPENGTVKFDYGFSIRSLIAIAPTCDQYRPAGRAVELEDLSYLLVHGSHDHDVTRVMGEKQYNNIYLSGSETCFKSSLYILGANHGQFNSRWGRYDLAAGFNEFLDVKELLPDEAQQSLLRSFVKIFLDVTLRGDESYRSLFFNVDSYRAALPATAYAQRYQSGAFEALFDFDRAANPGTVPGQAQRLTVSGCRSWRETGRGMGTSAGGEDYALCLRWEHDASAPEAAVELCLPETDLTERVLSFDLADMREDAPTDALSLLEYRVKLTDASGKTAEAAPRAVLPTLAVQLYKPDALFGLYEYKHPFTTVLVTPDDFTTDESFALSRVKTVTLIFPGEQGSVAIDNIGVISLDAD